VLAFEKSLVVVTIAAGFSCVIWQRL